MALESGSHGEFPDMVENEDVVAPPPLTVSPGVTVLDQPGAGVYGDDGSFSFDMRDTPTQVIDDIVTFSRNATDEDGLTGYAMQFDPAGGDEWSIDFDDHTSQLQVTFLGADGYESAVTLNPDFFRDFDAI